MIMRKTKKISVLFICLLFIFVSCDDLLEPQRDNRLSLEQVKGNPAYAEGILLAAYQALQSSYNFNEVATDDAVNNNTGNNFRRMATGEWRSTFSPVSAWNRSYNQLYNINYFLSICDDITWSWQSEERNRYFLQRLKGEAYGLRAMYGFDLLQAHSGISASGELLGFPIVDKVLSVNDDLNLPRSQYMVCVEQLLSDCDLALANLGNVYQNTGNEAYDAVFGITFRNRISGEAVKALRSRILLHAASPAFTVGLAEAQLTSRWTDAAVAAGTMLVEKGGIAGLTPNGHLFYIPVTSPSLRFDNDIIWRNDYVVDNTLESNNYPPSFFGTGRVNPTQNFVDVFPMANGYPITHPQSGYNASNPYTGRDPRLQHYVVYNGNTLRRFFPVNTTTSNLMDGTNTSNNSTRTGYYLKKFMHPDINLTPGSANQAIHFYTHFRYTEVFLNYAEAANEAWGPDGDPNGLGFTARSVISAIRKRAGITQPDNYLAGISSKEEMRAVIRNERRIELSFEGFRFWDIRRWNASMTEACRGVSITAGDVNTFEYIHVEDRRYDDYMIYGPIPYNETLKYDLKQNRGW